MRIGNNSNIQVLIHESGMLGVSAPDWEIVLVELPVYVHNINRLPTQVWVVDGYDKTEDWQIIGDY